MCVHAGLEVLRCSTVASVVLTSVGIALAAYGEVRLSLLGLAINTVSAFGESIRLVMTQVSTHTRARVRARAGTSRLCVCVCAREIEM